MVARAVSASRGAASARAARRAGPRAPRAAAAESSTAPIYNFSAGPATLPADVLATAQAELVDWHGSGMSVLEMSHRGPEFLSIYDKAVEDFRALYGIPDNYKVLFMQGGASTQFAALPLNLTKEGDTVDYVLTGSWGSKACSEAKKYCNVNVAASDKENNFTSIPDPASWKLSDDSKYVHICANETIQGVEFKSTPDVGDRLLIADMSSNFCSKPVDIEKYGVIYGGAQKNIGPSGVTIVIVREDLLGNMREYGPTMLDYKVCADNDSMYNTPPCYSIYICGLVFAKLLAMGGLEAVEKINIEKANLIYDAIAESDGFYKCPVDPAVRSLMNIPFTMDTPDLEKQFLKDAAADGLIQLKGHRSVGGIRASVYNAMPMEGAQKLADFMKEFRAKNS